MFFVRCAFWLSVVYGAIFWHGGRLRDLPVVAARVEQVAAQHVTQAATSSMTAYCQPNMARCLADAARLTALIEAGKGEAAPDALLPAGVSEQVVPVPVRRPRGVMLTRSP